MIRRAPLLGRGNRELGDDAGRRDPADLVASTFGEPEVAVRAGRDADGLAAGRGDGELGDAPAVVIRPILLASPSANQRLPSGPAVMPWGRCRPWGSETP